MNIDKITKKLLVLTKKAESIGEVPISALIVYNNKILCSAYNTVEKDNNVLSHAEIKVIKSATKKLNNWRLDNCELYVTIEPCDMCKEIIKKARIKNVYYFTKQNNNKTEKNTNCIYLNNNDCFLIILKNFFNNKR